MNNGFLQIDVSSSKEKEDDDIIKIRFGDDEIIQMNFTKFFFQSKYLRGKLNAFNSIQDEIYEINMKMKISVECIKSFIQLVQEKKVNIPIESYKDICTLLEYFCIQKFK